MLGVTGAEGERSWESVKGEEGENSATEENFPLRWEGICPRSRGAAVVFRVSRSCC